MLSSIDKFIPELFRPLLLGLLLMDELHEDSLILKHITLSLKVEVVIQMSVDLLILSVLLEQPSEDSHAPNPQHFDRHSSVGRTLSFSGSGVSALTPSLGILADAGT